MSILPEMSDQEAITLVEVPAPASVARFDLPTLAKMHGQIRPGRVVDGDTFSTRHMVAATMHGWTLHEKRVGPLLLTSEEYLEALKASDQSLIHPPADRR